MKVINIHKRTIPKPINMVAELFETLGTSQDEFWPRMNWPSMWLERKLGVGVKGGHGIIRYTVIEYVQGRRVVFKFSAPENFNGTHTLIIEPVDVNKTRVIHEIYMTTSGFATLNWVFVIRWLHDALIEEAFDRLEVMPSKPYRAKPYNLWVSLLRTYFTIKQSRKKNLKPVS